MAALPYLDEVESFFPARKYLRGLQGWVCAKLFRALRVA